MTEQAQQRIAQLTELLEPGDKALDADIRAMAKSIAKDLVEFRILIERARTENLWERLGFKSWTAYISDVISRSMTALPVDDRRAIVAVLDSEGMSQRAIATAIGVSQKTVDRDLDEVSHRDSVDSPVDDSVAKGDDSVDRRVGLDGKSRPAHPKPKPEPKAHPKPKPEPDEPVLSREDLQKFIELDKRIDAADARLRQHGVTTLRRLSATLLPRAEKPLSPGEMKALAELLERVAGQVEEQNAQDES